jgi:hypothetical protein
MTNLTLARAITALLPIERTLEEYLRAVLATALPAALRSSLG